MAEEVIWASEERGCSKLNVEKINYFDSSKRLCG